MNFPLLRLPRRVVHVDDSGDYLEMLQVSIRHGAKEFIHSGMNCVHAMKQEVPHWRAVEAALVDSVEAREKLGGDGEAEYFVRRYFRDWRRFRVTGVLVVDYQMPGMNGVEALRELKGTPTRKVLLTGQADDKIGMQAFNDHLVEKFIPKDRPDITNAIRACHEEMHRSVCENVGHCLRPLLSPAQMELLDDPAVTAALERKVAALRWIEYVVVGQPFGLLGMGETGPLQWMQLETQVTAQELAEAEAESDRGYSESELRQIAAGSALPTHEINFQLGLDDAPRLYPAEQLCTSPPLYAAVRNLEVDVLSAGDYGLDDILLASELVQARLRDVRVARSCADRFDVGADSYDVALRHFAELAGFARGRLQQDVLRAMAASSLPARVREDLQRAMEASSVR